MSLCLHLHSYKHNDITTLLCRYLCLCRYVANVNKALQCARLSPCRNVRMAKNFLADWTCNNLSDENPLGTRVQLLVTEGRGSHSSIFGRHPPPLPHIFFSCFLVLSQCNRYNSSCPRRRLHLIDFRTTDEYKGVLFSLV